MEAISTFTPEPYPNLNGEDDVAELIEWIATLTFQGDRTDGVKGQLRTHLMNLIDQRVQMALRGDK